MQRLPSLAFPPEATPRAKLRVRLRGVSRNNFRKLEGDSSYPPVTGQSPHAVGVREPPPASVFTQVDPEIFPVPAKPQNQACPGEIQ